MNKYTNILHGEYGSLYMEETKPGNVIIHKNPDACENINAIKCGAYKRARSSIDDDGNIYVWISEISHDKVSRAIEVKFVACFDYVNGDEIMYEINDRKIKLSEEMKERLKYLFPLIKSINPLNHQMEPCVCLT